MASTVVGKLRLKKVTVQQRADSETLAGDRVGCRVGLASGLGDTDGRG